MEDIEKDKVITWHDELRDDFNDVCDSNFLNGCVNAILLGILTFIVCFGLIVAGIAFSYR